MGGNALKAFGVERKSKPEYEQITQQLAKELQKLFAHTQIACIPAYAQKPSFGDADFLLSAQDLPSHWTHTILEHFKPQAFVHNGDVHSFDYQKLQIDLITIPKDSFSFALHYFSYNDLGNLMGRCAHKMGFKLGHLGLFYPLKDNDHLIAELFLTKNPKEAFEFLGYSYERYQQGMSSLEDIFQYTSSSPYFSPEIFLLHNRNAKSRIRDAKRPTYNQFLTWLEQHNPPAKMQWHTQEDLKQIQKQSFLARAFQAFPQFAQSYQNACHLYAQQKALAEKFNGQKVQKWTGRSGQDLGMLMRTLKNHPDFSTVTQDLPEAQLEQWVQKISSDTPRLSTPSY